MLAYDKKNRPSENPLGPFLALTNLIFGRAAYLCLRTDFLMLDFALWDFFAPLRDLVDLLVLLRTDFFPLPAALLRVVAIVNNLLKTVEGALEFTATSQRHPKSEATRT